MQAYRTNWLSKRPNERKLLGQTLTHDGITYLIALLCKCIQDNSGYVDARRQQRAINQQPFNQNNNDTFPRSTKAQARGQEANLDFAVAKSPAAATKFTFAGSRHSGP